MPKPQKETRDKMYDTFSDFDLASQEMVLACLQELHRQAKRKANKELTETLYPSGTSESAVAKLPELHWGGPLIGDSHVNHIDGDPRNNDLSNLEIRDMESYAVSEEQARAALQITAAGRPTDTDLDEKPVFKQKDA